MKISMTVAIDVDADEWTAEFGRDDVREHVKAHFLTLLQECGPSTDGIVKSIEIKR